MVKQKTISLIRPITSTNKTTKTASSELPTSSSNTSFCLHLFEQPLVPSPLQMIKSARQRGYSTGFQKSRATSDFML